jgi:hypothetical protein
MICFWERRKKIKKRVETREGERERQLSDDSCINSADLMPALESRMWMWRALGDGMRWRWRCLENVMV